MNNKNLKRQEALKARLNVRELFVKNAIKNVYDNICQSLSFVRLQLADPRQAGDMDKNNHMGWLVGQSIKDLRSICKSLGPDADLEEASGFPEVARRVVVMLYGAGPIITIQGEPGQIKSERKLILFDILTKILISTGQQGRQLIELVLSFKPNEWLITVAYNGAAIKSKPIMRRLQLVNAKLNTSETGIAIHSLQLMIAV